MKTLFRSLLAFSALAALALPHSADAANIRVCATIAAGTASGPQQWKAPTSGTVYSTNNRGCFVAAATDVGEALAAGFVADPPAQTVTGLTGGAVNSAIQLPAAAYIDSIVVQETSGSSVSGGFKVGTTSGGTDVISTAAVAASSLISIPDVSMSKRVFSSTAAQTLFLQCGNTTTGGVCSFTVRYGWF